MGIFCDSTFQPRKPRARTLVFGSDSILTRAHLPAFRLAIGICLAPAVRVPQRSRSRSAATRGNFFTRTRSFSTQILFSHREYSPCLLITTVTQSLNWREGLC